MGVDEIFVGKKQKFITVVSNLETPESLWFGRERKKETFDKFFAKQLSPFQLGAVRAACVNMWEPFRQSLTQWSPKCRIIYAKVHIMKHAEAAVDEVRRAEFFRKGGPARELVKGKRWLLLMRWVHLTTHKKRQLNALFALNPKAMKQGLSGSRRGGERQHQSPAAPGTRLPQPQLPAVESSTAGRHKNPTRRLPESRVKRTLLQILVKSRKNSSKQEIEQQIVPHNVCAHNASMTDSTKT